MLKKTQKFTQIFLAWILLEISPLTLHACSICGCGDPLQAIGTENPVQGSLRLAFNLDYLTATAESDENPTQTESLSQKSLQTLLAYSPTADLTFVALLPFAQKDWRLTAGDEEAAFASPEGLGDMNVGLRWFLVTDVDFKNISSFNFAVAAGSTLPTGREDDVDSNGDRFDQHAQLGTGAWGPYAGVLTSWVVRNWSFSANLHALFHTVNAYQYHFGTAVTWGLQAQVSPNDYYALSLGLEGRRADQDTSLGDPQINTGGTVMDLTPGFSFKPAETWSLYAKVQIPFAFGLSGTQALGATAILGTQVFLN